MAFGKKMKLAIPKIRFTKTKAYHKYFKCKRCGYISKPKIRFTKTKAYHKYFKCKRCGYISKEKDVCPVCRKEGHLSILRR